MNCDRWGYFQGKQFHYWPDRLRGAKFYGIDPADPVYRERVPYEQGRKSCPVCQLHDARRRSFPCDVELARAADIEASGYPATFCQSCARAMPKRNDQFEFAAKCWVCEASTRQARPRSRNGGAYVDDGNGCVERVPSWMVEWSGNPGTGGGRTFQ